MAPSKETPNPGRTRIIWISAASVIIFCGLAYALVYRSTLDQAKLGTFFAGLQGIGALLTAVAIAAAFAQVREARRQLRDNRNWNRMTFALTFIPEIELFYEWEKELEGSFVKLVSRSTPLTQDELHQMFLPENAHAHLALKSYLNCLEAYCVAINRGLADEETAKQIFGFKLVRHWIELQPYIQLQRDRMHEQALFCELEKVAHEWNKRYSQGSQTYAREP